MNEQQTAAMRQALEANQYAASCLMNQLSTKTKHAHAVDKLNASSAALRHILEQQQFFVIEGAGGGGETK